jgi:peptidoglycan/xylan/chitin deacetylase (PgdA/CDA1 family)
LKAFLGRDSPLAEGSLSHSLSHGRTVTTPALDGVRSRTLGLAAQAIIQGLQHTSLRAGVAVVYHEVGEAGLRPRDREVLSVLDERLFCRQVEHLRDHYRPVPASELCQSVRSRRRGDPFPVAVTFDDDLRSHHDVAAPELARRGMPATFFLSGAWLDGPGSFWWERLQRAIDQEIPVAVGPAASVAEGLAAREIAAIVEALEPEEQDAFSEGLAERLGADSPDTGLRAGHVRALADAGFEVGFHTRMHRVLTRLTDSDLEQELRGGRPELEDAAGRMITSLAYPHGAADARVAQAAAAARYSAGFTTDGVAVSDESDAPLLPRVYPSRSSPGHFAIQLARILLREARSAAAAKRTSAPRPRSNEGGPASGGGALSEAR